MNVSVICDMSCNTILFLQVKALVNLLGYVDCKEKCGPSVSVSLTRLTSKHGGERKTVELNNDSGEFIFSNVLPGKYKLEVKFLTQVCQTVSMGSLSVWCKLRSSISFHAF